MRFTRQVAQVSRSHAENLGSAAVSFSQVYHQCCCRHHRWRYDIYWSLVVVFGNLTNHIFVICNKCNKVTYQLACLDSYVKLPKGTFQYLAFVSIESLNISWKDHHLTGPLSAIVGADRKGTFAPFRSFPTIRNSADWGVTWPPGWWFGTWIYFSIYWE